MLPELLQIAREIKGWSLRDLERETGISNALLSQMERGDIKSPSFTNVVRVCEALGLPIERAAETVSLRQLKKILRKDQADG